MALTYDGSNITLHANGRSETNAIGNLNTQKSRLWIGAETLDDGGSFRDFFKGAVDDVRIYNRALSSEELQQMYQAEKNPATVLHDPTIVAQPRETEVRLGETATFEVRASGTGPLRYQWRFNGARIVGATSTNLVLPDITALDAGEYTVQVTDDVGSTLSHPAKLTIFRDSDGDGLSDSFETTSGGYQLVQGSFTWHEAKADAEKRGGHLATITTEQEWLSLAAAVGLSPTGDALWNGAWIGATDEAKEGEWRWITGETWAYTRWLGGEPNNGNDGGNEDYAHILPDARWNDQPSFPHPSYLLEKGYRTDPNNPDTDGDGFNDGAEFEAGTIPTDPASRPLPKIIAQPDPTNAIVGASFTLSIQANGYGPITYQWLLNGQPVLNATNATLTVGDATHAKAGAYAAVVKNAAGSTTTQEAVVRVTPVLDIQRLENGFVILVLTDERALAWQVEASTDLVAWTKLGAMTYTDGQGAFLDATAAGKQRRYYRVVVP